MLVLLVVPFFNTLMKSLFRNIILNSFALSLLPKIVPGVEVSDGFLTFLLGGFALSIILMILKPIITILTFPLNFITFGAFSLITNAILLYVLTLIITDVGVNAFTYEKFSFAGFVIPSIHFNTFFSYIFSAIILSALLSFFQWLLKK